MKDYTGMYNERFMKRAPQYGANARARTYQDYMRNIQNQRVAAGQTFGNLAMQQQNQSFYDRAMGRPPGLSGGMAQQFQNQLSGARARQLGQTAQQRYQAFSDIAAQEGQANQFARAEAAAEQQFQAQELQFQSQRQAQAKAIMATGQAQEVKEAQLRDLGFTYGEIERLQPSAGAAVTGGAMTAGLAGFGGAKAYGYSQVSAAREILGGDAKVVELADKLKAAQDMEIKAAVKNEAGDIVEQAVTSEMKQKEIRLAEQALKEGKEEVGKEIFRLRGKALTPKGLDKQIKTLADLSDDAITAAQKTELARLKAIKAAGLKKFGAKSALTKAAVAKKTLMAAAPKVLAGLGVAVGVFIAFEGLSTLFTGVGVIEGLTNLVTSGDYQRGKTGLLGDL